MSAGTRNKFKRDFRQDLEFPVPHAISICIITYFVMTRSILINEFISDLRVFHVEIIYLLSYDIYL